MRSCTQDCQPVAGSFGNNNRLDLAAQRLDFNGVLDTEQLIESQTYVQQEVPKIEEPRGNVGKLRAPMQFHDLAEDGRR